MKLTKLLERVEYECINGSVDVEVADLVNELQKSKRRFSRFSASKEPFLNETQIRSRCDRQRSKSSGRAG